MRVGQTIGNKIDWDQYCLDYDTLSALRPYVDMMSFIVSHIPSVSSSKKLLDASCGTGNLEIALLNAGKLNNFSVTAIDLSCEMLAAAEKKHRNQNNVSFLRVNLDEPLLFGNESFDYITCINTLYTLPRPEVTLKEFHRVLKQGSKIIISTPKKGYENGLILKEHCQSNLPDNAWEGIHTSMEREVGMVRMALSSETLVDAMLRVAHHNRLIATEAMFHFYAKEELYQLLVNSGFAIETLSLTYADQAVFVVATKL